MKTLKIRYVVHRCPHDDKLSEYQLGIEQNDELCKAIVNQVKCDLINSGCVPNVEIPLLKPTNRLIWLGTLSIAKGSTINLIFYSRYLSMKTLNIWYVVHRCPHDDKLREYQIQT
jgi:hypothetical protein